MISLLHLTLLALTAISVVEAYRIGQIGTQLNLEKLNFEKYRVSSNPLASESPSLRRFQSQLFADRQPDRRITRESENEFFESEFDKRPVADRLPLLYAFLGAMSLPFIVGLVVLYSNK